MVQDERKIPRCSPIVPRGEAAIDPVVARAPRQLRKNGFHDLVEKGAGESAATFPDAPRRRATHDREDVVEAVGRSWVCTHAVDRKNQDAGVVRAIFEHLRDCSIAGDVHIFERALQLRSR